MDIKQLKSRHKELDEIIDLSFKIYVPDLKIRKFKKEQDDSDCNCLEIKMDSSEFEKHLMNKIIKLKIHRKRSKEIDSFKIIFQ